MNWIALRIFVISLLVFITHSSYSTVFQLEKTVPLDEAGPRWMFADSGSPPKDKVTRGLWDIKEKMDNGAWRDCLQAITTHAKSAKGIQLWLTYAEIKCLVKSPLTTQSLQQRMRKALTSIEGNADSLNFFLSSSLTREPFLDGQMKILEKDVKSSRALAWKRISALQKMKAELSDRQSAELYRSAGDLSFIEQNLSSAWDFYNRSLTYRDQKELRKKVELIKKSLKIAEESVEEKKSEGKNDRAVFTKEELKLVARMKEALRSKDYVSAVQDGLKIIEGYPGGEWSDWASDQVLKVYLGVVTKSDKRYASIRRRILRIMRSADSHRLYRWALNAWSRGAYKDAATLCAHALEKLRPHPDEKKILLLGANSSVSAGDYEAAKKFYLRLANQFAGTDSALEARFRLGLLFYRLKDFARAASEFEKIIANISSNKFRLESLYWNWRAYQNAGRKGTEELAQQLVEEFPLTYYGLRARAELNGGRLDWKTFEKEKKTFKIKMSLTDFENRAWERFNILLSAGWLEEAQEELKRFPEPSSPEQKLLIASLWAKTLNHYRSIKTVNEAWDEDPSLRTKPMVGFVFPREFSNLVDKEAKSFGLPADLILALIRQESSFRPKALSPANAAGLMQIMPATARDIAKFLRWKGPLSIPDSLFTPSQNIHFGASYLKRMVRAFDGHLPLALAAYNAGIGRMRRWLNTRPDLGVDERDLDSDPEKEVWIDEIPWDETRYYVKAILRNYLIYQWLSEKEALSISKPVWTVSQEAE